MFFDSTGYQTVVADRNDNEQRLHYQRTTWGNRNTGVLTHVTEAIDEPQDVWRTVRSFPGSYLPVVTPKLKVHKSTVCLYRQSHARLRNLGAGRISLTEP
jgi:hypothetical protein